MRLLLVSAAVSGIAMFGGAKPLEMRSLHGSVVRMGSLHGEPLYGVRLRAFVCSRSSAEADRTVPTSFRIAHFVTSGRTATHWGRPFRVVENDLYWVVPLGETRGACGYLDFEDVIPPENYGGVESALGVLGYTKRYRCYGVRLTLRAVLGSTDRRTSTPISASGRTIIQCSTERPELNQADGGAFAVFVEDFCRRLQIACNAIGRETAGRYSRPPMTATR